MAKDMLDFNVEHDKEIDSSKKLKVGIIGTGWIADAHIQQYVQMPDVEIVAGADLVESQRPSLKSIMWRAFAVIPTISLCSTLRRIWMR